MKVKLYQDKTPTEPGQYLWRGAFSGNLDLITVVEIPEGYYYGIKWARYLGVCNYRNKNVTELVGFFSDRLETEY